MTPEREPTTADAEKWVKENLIIPPKKRTSAVHNRHNEYDSDRRAEQYLTDRGFEGIKGYKRKKEKKDNLPPELYNQQSYSGGHSGLEGIKVYKKKSIELLERTQEREKTITTERAIIRMAQEDQKTLEDKNHKILSKLFLENMEKELINITRKEKNKIDFSTVENDAARQLFIDMRATYAKTVKI